MKTGYFLFFLCFVFPQENFAAAVDEEVFLGNVAIKQQQLRDRLFGVTNPGERAEIYDQLIKNEVKEFAKGFNGFILQIWAEDLLQENPAVIEITMNKLSHRMGGFRQDILSSIAVAIATAPGKVYVPDEVINMLKLTGMYRSDYEKKLKKGPPSLLSNSEECYYSLLSVSRRASSEEIKKAYQKAAMQFHPDRNPGDPTAGEKFKERKRAYDTLIDPNKRERYDRDHGLL